MSLTSAMIDALLAAGGTAEQLAALVKADLAEQETKRASKRANNAERQQRYRDNRASRKNNASNALRDVTPPIDRTHTPSDISPNGENQNGRTAKSNPFPKPEWAEAQVWADWLEIRKQKKGRNTATAYAGFLADIAKLTNEEWPPGRLLEYAVRRSWAGIFEPKEGYPSNVQPLRSTDNFASLRGSRPNGALDMVLDAERELQAEAFRENPGADWPPRAALPSH